MSLPWEEYQSASAPTGDSKPWEQYAPADQGPWNDYPKRPTEDFSAAHAAARWQTAANLADTLSKYVAQPLSDIPGTALDAMENASIALGLSKRTSTPLSEQVKQTVRETAGNIGENIAHALNYTTAPELAAGRGVGEAVGELAQPQNLITLPALAGGGAVARGALAAITMQAAHAIPEQASEAGAASVEGTPEEKGKAFTGLGLSTLMVAAPLTYTALTEAPSRMPMEKMKLPGFEGLGIPQEHAPVPPEPAVAPKVPPILGPVATETAPTETAIDPEAVPKTELAPQSIKLSPDVPSFKLNADPVTGVAPGTKIEGPITTPITIWQRLNGDMEVVTGRGRLQTAKDRGDATIPVQIVKESDGFNKDQAITLDAEANIHDNTGRVEDTSAYFRNSPQLSRADAESRGLLSSPENEAAWDLGRNATPDVYSQFQSGQINQSEALAAARATTGGEPAAPAGSVPTVSDGAAAPSGAGADDGTQRINLAAKTSPTAAAMEAERPPTASTPISDGGDLLSPKGPGASEGFGGAAYGSLGQSQIGLLTHNVSATLANNPTASPASRVNAAQKIAASVASFKQSVAAIPGKSAVMAQAVWSALKSAYFDLPKWTTFKEKLGEWTQADQETTHNVRDWVKSIEKTIPDPIKREAITNFIQANGDDSVLASREAASSGPLKLGYTAARQLTQGEKDVAADIKNYLDQQLKDGIEAGLLRQGVQNYVNQLWKRPNPITQKLLYDTGLGNLRTDFKFARQRIFDSYFEGEQAGNEPVSKDIGQLIGAYDQAFNRSLSARTFVKQMMTAQNDAGERLVRLSGKIEAIKAPEGGTDAYFIKSSAMPRWFTKETDPATGAATWKPQTAETTDGRPYKFYSHPAFQDWKFIHDNPDDGPKGYYQADVYVHPDIYDHLKAALDSSPLRDNAIANAGMQAMAFAKQSKLSLSLFHLTQETLHRAFHYINPDNFLSAQARSDRADFLPRHDDIYTDPDLIKLGQHGALFDDPRGHQIFAEGVEGGGWVGKIPVIGKYQSAFSEWLFRDMIPRLKAGMGLDALRHNRSNYADPLSKGKISEDQLYELTARQMNAAFGEQNYRMIGRSALSQDLARIFTLAPDFLESRAKFVGQALRPYGSEQRIAIAMMAGTMYVGARALNEWLDGKPHLDDPFAVYHNGQRYSLRSVVGDLSHLVQDPRSFIYNRLSPASRLGTEFLTGRDDRGIKRSSWEQVKDLLSWALPIPLEKREGQSWPSVGASSMGFSSNPASPDYEVYKLADNWLKSAGGLTQSIYEEKQGEKMPESILHPMISSLQHNDIASAQKAQDSLLRTGRSEGDIAKSMKSWAIRPYTGSRQNESRFIASLSADDKAAYDGARAARIAALQSWQTMNEARAKALSP